MRILVTGGTGYIGSHTSVALLGAGHDVTIVDNLANSRAEVVDSIERIAGRRPGFVHGDVRDRPLMRSLLENHRVEGVLHFAALKSVGESWEEALEYYDCNVSGSISLLRAMSAMGVQILVFSSSATVYGEADIQPVRETAPCAPGNPYGRTKRMVEQVIEDLPHHFSTVVLRYFNPAGAHRSGWLGESPTGVPNNLFPYVAEVASGARPHLRIFGDDYPTPDGTGVRDYIHIEDLADAHVAALQHAAEGGKRAVLNVGTGRGHSVREVVAAFEAASGKPVPCVVEARRPGDAAQCYADPSLAGEVLGWHASRDLASMCEDAWRWTTGTGREA